MSIYSYRDAAVRHGWEFLDLAHDREDDRQSLFAIELSNAGVVERFIGANQEIVIQLVEAVPSRRESMLRRMCKDNRAEQMGLILGAWQHCRKAVLVYDWKADHDYHFRPGNPYRLETARHGQLFDQLRERSWTRWPFQWGRSPFKGEKRRGDGSSVADYIDAVDNYNPETGTW